eukprot:TRINITY_DN830_c0_g1_i1.p1 TRINITY_DN830_c0_g1~~TRINITY_DN830_c0_g1_i1.p1  ORF type:complete len:403 (-),score=109.68 TRINITY_DN830_c0_g1_i1:94-1302(-)
MSYPTGLVNVRTTHGRYWCGRPDGTVMGDAETPQEWERWEVIPAGNSLVNLRNFHGGYLSVDQSGRVTADKPSPGNWETFQTTPNGDGFCFGTCHGTYIGTDPQGYPNGNAREARQWEQYYLIPTSNVSNNQNNNNFGNNNNNNYNNNNNNNNQSSNAPKKRHGIEGFLFGAVDKLVDSPIGRASVNNVLSDSKIGEGLKEALRVGVQKAITQLSRTDGYYLDPIVKILLPDSMHGIANTISKIGLFASEVENFVKSMNRSAESAAGRAMDIFMNSLFNMTLRDARDILMGQDDKAATNYFRNNCTGQINSTFAPIIRQTMSENRVLSLYNEVMKKVGGGNELLSFIGGAIGGQVADIESWVLQKAGDGLFFMIGNAEKEIRRNPAARVTDLLKEVFGAIHL